MVTAKAIETAPAGRNYALDYLRAAGLLFMSWTHMWRFIFGHGVMENAVLFIGETGHFLFFLAFGMTQNRLVTKGREEVLPFVLLFGLIGAFHSYFLLFNLAWEFFLFIWIACVAILVGTWVGLSHRQLLLLSVLILLLNAFVPLGVSRFVAQGRAVVPLDTQAEIAFAEHLWGLPGPFFPLPWAVVVFLGFAMGMEYPAHPRPMLVWAVASLALASVLAAVATARPDLPLAANLVFNKWAATSTYVVAGCAWAVLLYVAFAPLDRVSGVHELLYPPVRFLSDHLLEVTVLHYLVLRTLTAERFGWISFGPVRHTHWSVPVVLSIANPILLFALLKLVMSVWGIIERRCRRVLDHFSVEVVGLTALILWVVLRLSRDRVRLGYLRWTAYAAMLGIALFYRYDKERRRRLQPAAAPPR